MYVCHVCVVELINTHHHFIGYIIKQISKYPSVKLHRSKASGMLDISSMPSQKPISLFTEGLGRGKSEFKQKMNHHSSNFDRSTEKEQEFQKL